MLNLRNHSLTLALLALFIFSMGAMLVTGWLAHNETLASHQAPPISLFAYLGSGDFLSALFENWESEFLQMATYVILTAFLVQRGSAESRDPDGNDEPPEPADVRIAGSRLLGTLWSYSLGIVLGLIFVLSFAAHLHASARAANEEAALHGGPTTDLLTHLGDMRFWFESFQNWQSEFLATAALVVLSIFLRFRGSPESKRLDETIADTGR
jgi:hypothetical protein